MVPILYMSIITYNFKTKKNMKYDNLIATSFVGSDRYVYVVFKTISDKEVLAVEFPLLESEKEKYVMKDEDGNYKLKWEYDVDDLPNVRISNVVLLKRKSRNQDWQSGWRDSDEVRYHMGMCSPYCDPEF